MRLTNNHLRGIFDHCNRLLRAMILSNNTKHVGSDSLKFFTSCMTKKIWDINIIFHFRSITLTFIFEEVVFEEIRKEYSKYVTNTNTG